MFCQRRWGPAGQTSSPVQSEDSDRAPHVSVRKLLKPDLTRRLPALKEPPISAEAARGDDNKPMGVRLYPLHLSTQQNHPAKSLDSHGTVTTTLPTCALDSR